MARGIVAEQVDSQKIVEESLNVTPCYVGSAPYWQVDNENWANIAGEAYMISSVEDAKGKIGYRVPSVGRWPKEYSLGEPINLHFADKSNITAPIMVLVNKAEVTVAETVVQKEVAISNGKGYILVAGLGIISTLTVVGKTKGKDYNAFYDEKGENIILKGVGKNLGKSVQVTYYVVENVSSITMAESTFDVVDLLEQKVGEVPVVFLAPGWENEKLDGVTENDTVAEKLADIARNKVDNHWYTTSIVQLYSPTREDLITEKTGYLYEKQKVCWPFFKSNGLIYSMASIFAYEKLKVDTKNKGLPYESASNEIIYLKGTLCDATGKVITQIDLQANALNDIGIATAKFVSGNWRTCGIVMSNYLEVEKKDILPEYLSDVAVQMRDYVCNLFQRSYIDDVDKPIASRRVKEICDDFQPTLNEMVNLGALLLGSIDFYSADNTTKAKSEGEFVFAIQETNTPPGKFIKAKVSYTSEGLEQLTGGDE